MKFGADVSPLPVQRLLLLPVLSGPFGNYRRLSKKNAQAIVIVVDRTISFQAASICKHNHVRYREHAYTMCLHGKVRSNLHLYKTHFLP